ncbi:dihydroorotate dehydrogenase electron transfer subunit [bacterium]|nr:dihydroorotate dehydrogenase electron transfer subunit [bacterium]
MLARAARDVRGLVVSNEAVAPDAWVLRYEETDPLPPLLYEPGEFIQVSAWSVDPLLRRPMSVLDCGVRDGRAWASFLYQRTGRGTKILGSLRAGDRVRALGPLGNRFALPARDGVSLVVAGGVGVAPFLLLTRRLVEKGREVLVLLGARDAARLYLKEALEREGARVRCATEKGDLGEKGLVTRLLEQEIDARGPRGIARVYACGPEPMLRAVHAIARARGVEGEASLERRMACGFGVCFTCVCKIVDPATGQAHNERTCLEGPVVDFAALPLESW